ncbi:hypothetical protein [Lentibacillus salinarum]|uniref:Tetratricopeptide repeat protein n=1 Tax=Lentibacillus salinarum TaxID=446820 RepID=A0ABW3ZTP9_9BACI
MEQQSFYIYRANGKPIQIHVQRVVLYRQAEIIEALSDQNNMYYLFFYKHDFLTAAKATKLRHRSFIASAFKQGMVFDAPHPFIDVLLSENHPCRITRFDSLLKKLDNHYTPQEKACILTFFESFISKKRLFNEIKSIFYIYRRNGQNFLGYRIVRILMDFAPGHDFVKQLSGDRRFREYADLYHHKSADILAQDPIFTEKVLYAEKDKDHYFEQLIPFLDEASRWMDMMALYGNRLTENPSKKNYDPLIKLLDEHLNKQHTMQMLESLYRQLPHYAPLKQDLLKKYIDLNQLENVLNILDDSDVKLDASQSESINDMLEQLDLETLSLTSKQLQTLFKLTIDLTPKTAEHFIHQYVAQLMNTYEPSVIKKLLKPFIESRAVHPVYLKMDALVTYNDDLDQMQLLGELYYEFSQRDQAIECFSWEMELKPEDPKPLKWLAKVYQELGMKQEAAAYRQLCVNLQKRA